MGRVLLETTEDGTTIFNVVDGEQGISVYGRSSSGDQISYDYDFETRTWDFVTGRADDVTLDFDNHITIRRSEDGTSVVVTGERSHDIAPGPVDFSISFDHEGNPIGIQVGANIGVPGVGVVGFGLSTTSQNTTNLPRTHLTMTPEGQFIRTTFYNQIPGESFGGFVAVTLDQNGEIIGTQIGEMDPQALQNMAAGFPVDWYDPARCFVAGTKIRLSDGEEAAIEQIKEGELVSSFAGSIALGRGHTDGRAVVRTYTNVTQELVRLTFEDGRDDLVTTPGHAFLDETGAFTKIGDLVRLGGGVVRLIDETGNIVSATGTVVIYSAETADLFERSSAKTMHVNGALAYKEEVEEGWKVYNFEVEEYHTYVAGGIRVHNDSTTYTLNDDGTLETLTGADGEPIEISGSWTPSQAYHYGVIQETQNDDGSTTRTLTSGGIIESLSAAGRSFADLIGLDGRLGLQGTFSLPGEGLPDDLHESGQPPEHRVDWSGDKDGDNVPDYRDEDYSNIGHWGGDRDNDGVPNWRDRNDGVGWRDKNPGADGDTQGSGKPIILDMDGDGVEINVGGNVSFDMDADGFLEHTDWVGADDAFLVIDLNADGSRGAGDGKIDKTQELIFTDWLDSEGVTDLQALALFDVVAEMGGNNDGVISAADSVWSELRVWQDGNSNGKVDQGELRGLAALGFSQINLTYDDGTSYDDNSNDVTIYNSTLLGSASYTRNGAVVEGGVGDVALSYEAQGFTWVDTSFGFTLTSETGEVSQVYDTFGKSSSDVTLKDAGYDGSIGDDRGNRLDGGGSNKIVNIEGREGNDWIKGGNKDDVLNGGDGADTIIGAKGNDLVIGGRGNDEIDGWAGNDEIHAGDGDDRVGGQNGDDSIFGGAGADKLKGNGGNDRIEGGAGWDNMWGHSGSDTFVFKNGDGQDNDYLHDFENGLDYIEIDSLFVAGFADLTLKAKVAYTGASGVEISYGNGDRMFLEGLTVNQIDNGDFTFL